MIARSLSLALAALCAAGLSAQTLMIPAAANTGDLPSASGWPFDYAGNMRILYVYDAVHFTGQNVSAPIVITRMRIRADGATATWIGDTINSLTVDLSTAPVDFNAISTTYDNNHGPDRLRVYNSSLAIPAGSASAGSPGPFVVDVNFTQPFLYDPNAGDLTIDFVCSGPSNAANTPTIDASSTTGQALAKRVYGLSYAGSPTGSLWSGESSHAVEFTYSFGSGYASARTYGTGCYDGASTVYETFTGNFDLAGAPTNSLLILQNGNGGFTVVPGSNVFFTPASPDLLLGDDTLSASLALPFAFQFGTLSTSAVKMASNGYLWLRATETVSDLSPTVAELLTLGPRIAPYWTDLNPAALDPVTQQRIGSVHFDVDPVTNNPVFTWLNVPEYGSANTGNRNTFQIELLPGGAFEIRWQNAATTATRQILTGVSYGLGARDGGSYDLSAAVPFSTGRDANALRLAASGRPVLGSTINLNTSEIPANVAVGAMLFGLTKIDPGIDLASLGAPGCRQYTSIDASSVFFGTGSTRSMAMSFPNVPTFAGVQIKTQAAVLSPGANALGLLTTNGLELNLDVN